VDRGVEGWREWLGTVGGVWVRVCTSGLASVLEPHGQLEYLLSCYWERFDLLLAAHYAHSRRRCGLLIVSAGRLWCGGGAPRAWGRGFSLTVRRIVRYPQSPPN
jgi:hypothetical protein